MKRLAALILLTACSAPSPDVAITRTEPRPDARVNAHQAQPSTTTTSERVRVHAAAVTTTPPPETTEAPNPATGDVWWQLALCESGGRQDAVSPNGRYFGYFQFYIPTWRAYGGTGDPRNYSYEQQLVVAKRVQAGQGWGAWPACSRKLGLS